jgi:hypothetical protein
LCKFFFVEFIEFQGTELRNNDECHKIVMLVCCGGIYLEMGGWLLKKKAPLRPNERDKSTTSKMGGRTVAILAHNSHFCLGWQPKWKAM